MSLDQPQKPQSIGTPAAMPQPQPIIIQQRAERGMFDRVKSWFFYMILMGSIALNLGLYGAYQEYFTESHSGPVEKYYSGDKTSHTKIAVIRVAGTIMPPYTERILKTIKHVKDDDKVKGVLLVIDSPGGLVSDSHQIYHRLTELREKKPVVAAMQGIAASGGLYVAMGVGEKGKIFAEPTTWTGSIGVIIPHYEITELASKIGVKAAPLKTGPFKDALSPFREMTEADEKVWRNILTQAFDEFLKVIDDNRATLTLDQVKELATGQIYTARDAKQKGLVDEIGYEEDAINELKKMIGEDSVRVVKYQFATGLAELLGGSASASDKSAQWQSLLDLAVPRAMYHCSGVPFLPDVR